MGTPGSRRSRPTVLRPDPHAALAAVARGREAEILLRFGARLASLEIGLAPALLVAARAALLLEQAHALAAARALAVAEQQAAREITRRPATERGRIPLRRRTKRRRLSAARPWRRRQRAPAPSPGG